MSFALRTAGFRSLVLGGVSVTALAIPDLALAQDVPLPAAAAAAAEAGASGADGGADAGVDGPAIVVTASRRRQEKVQDVPVAITAIGAPQLERRGDYTLGQIQAQIPSLQVFSFNPRNTNINIRGLGSTVALTNDGLENGVGFYIDDVFYGRVGLSQFDLVDLEKVEVLRGPQGTLFGKNTTAGVINITSRKPSFDPEFSGEFSLGNYGYYQLRASASGPIIADKLAIRLSGALTQRNGFLWNTTQKRDAQDYYNASIRGQLLFTPTDDVSLRIIGDYSKQKQNYSLGVFVADHRTYADGVAIANNFDTRAARFPGYVLPAFRPFDRQGEADSHYQANMEGYGVSGAINWDLGPVALTSITAYRWWDWYPANDGDGTSLPVMTKAQQQNFQRQFSQEVRLASSGDNRVNYVIGAYYFWQIIRGYGASAYGPAAALWNRPPASPIPLAIWDAALNGFEADSTSTPETKSIAAFGQLDWKITDSLTLTTALRYTHEEKKGAYSQFWVAGSDLSALTAPQAAQANSIRTSFNPVTSYSSAFSDNSLSGLVTLGWKVAPDALLYATYSRGNKSGGLNLTVLPAGVVAAVKPEKVDAFEIGFKTQFLDRRVTFNGAAYWTEIGNYQTNISDSFVSPTTGATISRQYIANIPKVRSRGFEAELNAAPTDWLSFNGTLAYTDAIYVTYTNAPQAPERLDLGAIQDLSGASLPGVPKWSWTLGADARLPLGELGGRGTELYAHADYAYRSHFNTQNNGSNSIWADVPGYGLVNARIGFRTADGLLDIALWAKNLFNVDYFNSLSAATTGVVTGQIGEPRTFGVTFRTKL